MREELIRFENVTRKMEGQTLLRNLHFYLLKGEVMAMLVLQDRGKSELLRIILQNLPLAYGKVYYDGKVVNSYANSDLTMNRVSVIQENSSLIDSLSVADNMFVMRKGFQKFIIDEHVLTAQASRFLDELGISIDLSARVSSLSRMERVIVEMVRAILSDNQLLILYHISNFLSQTQMVQIFRLINKLKQQKISFLYFCNHHEEAFQIADRTALFMNDSIYKILERDEMTNDAIAPYIIHFHPYRDSSHPDRADELLRFDNVMYCHIQKLSFDVKKGECVTLIDADYRIPKEIVKLLTGDDIADQGHIIFNGKPYERAEATHFLDCGIAIVPANPIKSFLFYGSTYLENLTFLLDKKLGKDALRTSYLHSVRQEYASLSDGCIDVSHIDRLSAKQLFSLVYNRILLFHPKLAVLVQPLANGDMYCRSHILDLIQSLKKRGISILILAASTSDNLTPSDRLIVLKNGVVVSEYSQDEFSLISK